MTLSAGEKVKAFLGAHSNRRGLASSGSALATGTTQEALTEVAAFTVGADMVCNCRSLLLESLTDPVRCCASDDAQHAPASRCQHGADGRRPQPLRPKQRSRGLRAAAGALKPVYWQALAVVVVLYFARFDWSFVVLRAKQARWRWKPHWLPTVIQPCEGVVRHLEVAGTYTVNRQKELTN